MDRVCIITGANTGIGLEVARNLAFQGFHVILACRDNEKCAAAIEEIKKYCIEKLPRYPPKVEGITLDLSSLQSVEEFVREFKQRNLPLHVLINNAGVFIPPLSHTKEGYELQFGVNYLAHFKLTLMLLDVMMQSDSARIINVSSRAHKAGNIDLKNLDAHSGYSAYKFYAQSKLALLLFTYELHRRLEAENIKNVTVNAVHPGLVRSEMQRHIKSSFVQTIMNSALAKPFMISPQQGAKPIIILASSSQMGGISGKYYNKNKEARSSSKSYSKSLQKKLWNVSEKLVGIKFLQ